jgi:hypothetical protein
MGSSQSTQAQSSTPSQMTAEEMQLKQIEQSMPRYTRPETFEEKVYRKVSFVTGNYLHEREGTLSCLFIILFYSAPLVRMEVY